MLSRAPGAHGLLALAVALTATGAGCFYIDPINERPNAVIHLQSTGPHYISNNLVLDAFMSADPDGDPIKKAEWRACTIADRDCGFQERPVYDDFVYAISEQVPISVALRVTDDNGATDTDTLIIEVDNKPPEIDVRTQGREVGGDTYQVATPVDIIADATDPDCSECAPPALTWTLYPPTGSSPDDRRFEAKDDDTYELFPDIPGQWDVEITARDDAGAKTTVTETIVIGEDQPPCIAQTSPDAAPDVVYVVDATGAPRTFAILAVDDELDPYPPRATDGDQGVATFSWQVASPVTGGELVPVAGHAGADLTVDPAIFSPGDRLSLRVEVRDRADSDILCPADEPTCSWANDGCLQRVTWEVVVR